MGVVNFFKRGVLWWNESCLYARRDGNLADLAKAGSLHEFLMELHQTFGPIASFWMEQKLTVSIASPELFKEHSHVFDRPRK